jgi:hypothetical protein
MVLVCQHEVSPWDCDWNWAAFTDSDGLYAVPAEIVGRLACIEISVFF